MAEWEKLPFDLTEELKAKNLSAFVNLEESSCNLISIIIYENQKYRPLIRDWGSIIGVHIFPAVDRRPYTNERGTKALLGTLSDISPIKGFKWGNDWTLMSEEGVTDAEGFQYARNWSLLHDGGSVSPAQQSLSFVRRRKWKRFMIIDLDLVKKSLPYDIFTRIVLLPLSSHGNNPNNTANNPSLHGSIYVEFFVNDQRMDSGSLCGPTWSKEFIQPLPFLDPFKKFAYNLNRNGKLLASNIQNDMMSDNIINKAINNTSSNKYTIEVNVEDILTKFSEHNNQYTMIFYQDKYIQGIIEWKINENSIFHIENMEKYFSEGQLSEMVLSEGKLSQRLKEKIIMLSLGLGSNCNGLLREITHLISEGQSYITDLDLIEVLDDINQIQNNNEFGRVISLLKVAENANREDKIQYPYNILSFSKYMLMQILDGLNSFQPKVTMMRSILSFMYRNERWFHQQPYCLPNVMKDYYTQWCQSLYQSYQSQRTKSMVTTEEYYTIQLLLRGETVVFELRWTNIIDYFEMLKLLSMMKNHQSGVYNYKQLLSTMDKEDFCMESYLIINHHDLSLFVTVSIDFENECIDIYPMDEETLVSPKKIEGYLGYLPARIPFEYVEAVVISHSYLLSMDCILEIQLLSATTFAVQEPMDYNCHVQITTINGQHYQNEFVLNKETGNSNQPATGEINDSIRLLCPSYVMKNKELFEEYLNLSFFIEQLPTSTSSSVASTPSTTTTKAASSSTQEHASPKKDSKRYSFSFAPPPAPLSFASLKDSMDSSANSTKSNRNKTTIQYSKLGQSNIPYPDDIRSDQELQLIFEKKHYQLQIQFHRIIWNQEEIIQEKLKGEFYGMIYLIDIKGNVILPPSIPVIEEKSLLKKKSHHDIKEIPSLFKLGHIARTSTLNLQDKYTWKEEMIELDTKVHPSMLENAMFTLIEIHHKELQEDIVIGEVMIPFQHKQYSQNTDNNNTNNTNNTSHQHEAFVIHRVSNPTNSNKATNQNANTTLPMIAPFDLGVLIAKLSYQYEVVTPTLSRSNSSQLNSTPSMKLNRMKANVMRLIMRAKPIQSIDCSWPCQIITHGQKTLDPNIFYLSIAQDGLHISLHTMMPGLLPSLAQDWVSILEQCQENRETSYHNASVPSHNGIHLIIPYQQLSVSDLFILSDHMMIISFTIKRKLISHVKTSSAPSTVNMNNAPRVVYKDVRMEWIIGPCLAEDLYTCISNRIALQPLRNQLVAHIINEKESEESFQKLSKTFQDVIYETILRIEQSVLDETKSEIDFDIDEDEEEEEEEEEEVGSSSADHFHLKDLINEVDDEDEDGCTTNLTLSNLKSKSYQHSGHDSSMLDELSPCKHSVMTIVDLIESSLTVDHISKKKILEEWNRYFGNPVNFANPIYNKTVQGNPLDPMTPSSFGSPSPIRKHLTISTQMQSPPETNMTPGKAPSHHMISIANCAMKLLYLKKATLKIYLWYLVEQSPIQFSAEKHYLEANWILFDHADDDLSYGITSSDDVETLIFRISDIMHTLEQDVRHQILRAFRMNTNDISNQLSRAIYTKYLKIIAMLYKAIEYTPASLASDEYNTNNGSQSIVLQANTNPQKKRDLIKYIITHDDIFEHYLNASLRSHNYSFHTRPLLSLCLDFDQLVNQFSEILDNSILMWNNRTLQHFMKTDQMTAMTSGSTKASSTTTTTSTMTIEASNGSSRSSLTSGLLLATGWQMPWEIHHFINKEYSQELIISHIPETIQMQLNVEIGLKKISIQNNPHLYPDLSNSSPSSALAHSFFGEHSSDHYIHAYYHRLNKETLKRIETMNYKISQAIIRSYLSLAVEYEKTLKYFLTKISQYYLTIQDNFLLYNQSTIKPKQYFFGNTRTSNRLAPLSPMATGTTSLTSSTNTNNFDPYKDDFIFFLISILNDCERISHVHIPESIQLFAVESQGISASNLTHHTGSTYHRRKSVIGSQNRLSLTHAQSRQRQTVSTRMHRYSFMSTQDSLWGEIPFMNDDNNNNNDENNHSSDEKNQSNSLSESKKQQAMTFGSCLKAITAVTRQTIHELTNQIFVYSELKYYIFEKLDYSLLLTLYLPLVTGSLYIPGASYASQQPTTGGNNNSNNPSTPINNAANANNNAMNQLMKKLFSLIPNKFKYQRHILTFEYNQSNEHTAIEVILATLTEYFGFINNNLNIYDLEKTLYLCIMKLFVRYLLYIRTVTKGIECLREMVTKNMVSTRRKSVSSASLTPMNSPNPRASYLSHLPSSDSNSMRETNDLNRSSTTMFNGKTEDLLTESFVQEIIDAQYCVMKKDVKDITNFLVSMKNKLHLPSAEQNKKKQQHLTTTLTNKRKHRKHRKHNKTNNNNQLDTVLEGNEDSAENSSGSDNPDIEEIEDNDDEDNEYTTNSEKYARQHSKEDPLLGGFEPESRYESAMSMFMKVLSNYIFQLLTDDYQGNQQIENYALQAFSLQFPEFKYDLLQSYEEMETMFKEDPAFIHFIAPMIDTNTTEIWNMTRLCNLQIGNLACYKVKKYKNLFLKLTLNGQSKSTKLASNNSVSSLVQWDDKLIFENIPLSSCKTLKIEIYAFRLRAFKVMRESLIGTININLVELLRSEIASDKAALPSYNTPRKDSTGSIEETRKSFSFSMANTNNYLTPDRTGQRSSNLEAMLGEDSTATMSKNFGHTSWYLAGSGKGFNDLKATSSRGKRGSLSLGNTVSSSSYINTLSSRGPRDDIDLPQLRVSIKTVLL